MSNRLLVIADAIEVRSVVEVALDPLGSQTDIADSPDDFRTSADTFLSCDNSLSKDPAYGQPRNPASIGGTVAVSGMSAMVPLIP